MRSVRHWHCGTEFSVDLPWGMDSVEFIMIRGLIKS